MFNIVDELTGKVIICAPFECIKSLLKVCSERGYDISYLAVYGKISGKFWASAQTWLV